MTSRPDQGPPRAGPWILESKLGEGGAGAVFVGRHEQTGIRRAIKLLRTNDGLPVERFRREGISLALVEGCPSIVRFHGSGGV
jgi:serine/threonine protein kinase